MQINCHKSIGIKCMQKFFTDNKFALSCGILGIIVLSVFGSIFLISKTADQVKKFGQNDNPYYNSISIDGTGEVVALPDVASFNFSVKVFCNLAKGVNSFVILFF